MEAVSWDLATELCQRGHEVTFLTTSIPSHTDGAVIDGIRVLQVVSKPGRYSRAWWRKSKDRYLTQLESSTDIVIGVGGGAHSIVKSVARSPKRVPIVIQSHGTPWGEFCTKLKQRSLRSAAAAAKNIFFILRDLRLRYYDLIIAVGPRVLNELFRLPMNALKGDTSAVVIKNGINETNFLFSHDSRLTVRRRLSIDSSAFVVLSLGKIIEEKGVFVTLDAFQKLQNAYPESQLIYLGEGRDQELLRERAADLGIANFVHFPGSQDRASVVDFYSASDVFIFPSLRAEGLSLAPLEASANGLHLVLSDLAYAPGLDAQVIIGGNASEYFSALKQAHSLTHDSVRSSRLPPAYTIGKAADAYETLLSELVTKTANARSL